MTDKDKLRQKLDDLDAEYTRLERCPHCGACKSSTATALASVEKAFEVVEIMNTHTLIHMNKIIELTNVSNNLVKHINQIENVLEQIKQRFYTLENIFGKNDKIESIN